MCTMASTPARAKAGVRKPRQKLTPSLGQPDVLTKVAQTSREGALVLVMKMERVMKKKKMLGG